MVHEPVVVRDFAVMPEAIPPPAEFVLVAVQVLVAKAEEVVPALVDDRPVVVALVGVPDDVLDPSKYFERYIWSPSSSLATAPTYDSGQCPPE